MASEKWIKDAEVEGDSLRNKYFKKEQQKLGSRTEKSEGRRRRVGGEGQETRTGRLKPRGCLFLPLGSIAVVE